MKKFEGWGTSLCWWANVNYPVHIKNQIIDLLFGDEGLKFNIVRYNLGGGYDKKKIQNMRNGALMPCIIDENGNFDLSKDYLQLDILNLSMATGNVDKVELFCNSPPYYMTKSGLTNGSTQNFDCNLHEEYIEDFSDYIVKCYKFFERLYPIVSVSPFNEPSNPFWTTNVNQEGCFYDYLTRKSVLSDIKANDKSVFIAGVEEFSSLFGLLWQTFSFNENIDRINIHGYHLKYNNFTFYFDDFTFVRRILRFFTTKDIWMSEYGWGYNDTIKDSLPLARQIFRDLDTFQPRAWIYWQSVEHMIGNWGLIQTDFNNPINIIVKKQYYILKHFTRFLRPGDKYVLQSSNFWSKCNILKITSNIGITKYIILNDTDKELNLDLNIYYNHSYIVQSDETKTYTKLLSVPTKFPPYSITSIKKLF